MVKYYVFKANLCFDLCNSLASLNTIDIIVYNLYLPIMCYFIFITSFHFHVNIWDNNGIVKDNRDTGTFAPPPKKKMFCHSFFFWNQEKGHSPVQIGWNWLLFEDLPSAQVSCLLLPPPPNFDAGTATGFNRNLDYKNHKESVMNFIFGSHIVNYVMQDNL